MLPAKRKIIAKHFRKRFGAKKGYIFAGSNSSMYLFLINSWFLFFHPFFVSVTEINYNTTDKTLEISNRVFTDDFENTLRDFFPGKKVDLMNPPANGSMDSLVKNYVLNKMTVSVNGQPKRMEYIGFERVDESIWTYFEVTGIESVKSLKIHNAMLYEYKKEQINMVHIINGKERQSRKLDNPLADWEFKF